MVPIVVAVAGHVVTGGAVVAVTAGEESFFQHYYYFQYRKMAPPRLTWGETLPHSNDRIFPLLLLYDVILFNC